MRRRRGPVDPARDPDELDWLAELVVGLRYRVRAVVATHAHHDHVLWHPAPALTVAGVRSSDRAIGAIEAIEAVDRRYATDICLVVQVNGYSGETAAKRGR